MAVVRITKKLKRLRSSNAFPDGPHPYRGPDEDIVRKIAEQNTASVLNKLFRDAKTMERFRHVNKKHG